MTEKDPNYIPKLEKAIAQKYGAETVDNPRQFWDEEKEKKYLEQSQNLTQRIEKINDQTEKVDHGGFLINKKLLSRENIKRTCTVCEKYSFNLQDDLYINKFETCYICYIKWVDGREERWKTGWRPNKEEV
tara:strand:+ start:7625 stop:8017 length:393 start_codon:yes stop_codon:yes gene_type:complete